MKDYKVTSDTGVVLEGADETIHAQGATINLDPEAEQTKALVANGAIEEVVAEVPPAAAPKPLGFFTLEVKYREGTTEAEIEAAQPWIQESTTQMADSAEDLFPHCIDAFTVKRDR